MINLLAYFFVAAIIVAAVIAFPILGSGLGKKKGKSSRRGNAVSLDLASVQRKWAEIEATADLGGPAQLKSAVMDADKLTEKVLFAKGLSGNTFAEKLKAGRNLFRDYDDYNNLWFAHKVRNSIAHDNDHDFSPSGAKKAIEYFRKALIILGAL